MASEGITRRSAVAGVSVLLLASESAARTEQAGHRHPSIGSADKEQQTFRFLALKMFVEADSAATNGSAAIVRVFVPAGEGAAPHVHSREDEVFTVLRGHYRFQCGDQEVEAPAGTTIFMPRGIPHTYRNVGQEPGEHVLTLVPGGAENMFREVSAAQLQMPRDKARYETFLAKYGMRSLPPDALPLSPGS